MDAEYRETCLPGTRLDFLNGLILTLMDPDPKHNVIWLRGLAGSGKSTILNTIAQHLSELRRCGAFLFWDRNDAVNGDPRRVIRTLAYKLGVFNSVYAEKLASQVEHWPNISGSSFNAQFQHLLQEPLRELAKFHDLGPIVIIFDALDERRTRETRKELLHELSLGLGSFRACFEY